MYRNFCLFISVFFVVSICAQTVSRGSKPRSMSAKHKMVNKKGEILVYADKFNPNVVTDDMPDALKDFLRMFREKEEVGGQRYSSRLVGKTVEPLLKSLRHQEYPFNLSCPKYIFADGSVSEEPCVSGCVATAIEQVVSYWRHPSVLADTLHGWQSKHYTIPDVMPGTIIDWDNILVNYNPGQFTDQQAKAIADLTYYLGIGAHMNWGPGSSGANLYNACDALYSAFDYKTIAFVQRGLYSNSSWNKLLRNELENGRPIVYTGHNFAFNGHCFNIDGVDEEGYYHVNWGEDLYDCYVDLDYMSPYEPVYDKTLGGIYTGLNMNQTALFLHPEDFEIDIWDTLAVDDALHGVKVDTVTFSRQPDVMGYVRADFSLTNTTRESLNFTFEVMTYLPSDTAVFKQCDYVGLSTVNLAPGEHKIWPVFCQFSKTGERLFGYSADDETIPFVMPVNIVSGMVPDISFSDPEYELIKYVDEKGCADLTARFAIDIFNQASSGVGCNTAGYFLHEEGGVDEVRHFDFFEVEAGSAVKKSVEFHHLIDGKTYEFSLRYPWEVCKTYTFTVHGADATDGIKCVRDDEPSEGSSSFVQSLNTDKYYDIQGRRLSSPLKGIYIKNGKKFHPTS